MKKHLLYKIFTGTFFFISPLISFAGNLEPAIEPKTILFPPTESAPNSGLPLLLYKNIIPKNISDGAEFLERLFANNNWIPMWRWQLFTYAHYHPNTHECVGVTSGKAVVELGDNATKVNLERGDVVVLPAGVSHRQISATKDFLLVGAYPPNMSPLVFKTDTSLMESAKKQIAKVPLPSSDPINGKFGGLLIFWKK